MLLSCCYTIAAGRYDRNDCTKSGLYQTMIMEENLCQYQEPKEQVIINGIRKI